MATAGGNGHLAPHMRPYAPRQHVQWMGHNPPSKRTQFWRCWGCAWPPKHSDVVAIHCSHNRRVFWGSYTPSTAPKIISACSGGCRQSIWHIGAERKVSWGALRGHFCQQQPWSAMVVLVLVGCCRLTSDQPTVGIVKIVYWIIFYSYVHPIHSWHLTWQPKREIPKKANWSFRLCLNPVLNGSYLAAENALEIFLDLSTNFLFPRRRKTLFFWIVRWPAIFTYEVGAYGMLV